MLRLLYCTPNLRPALHRRQDQASVPVKTEDVSADSSRQRKKHTCSCLVTRSVAPRYRSLCPVNQQEKEERQ